jgi:phosphoribosylanthranilate isomerase
LHQIEEMLPIKILASGITHLTDARYFAAWQVDWMSFPLDGPEAISPQMIMQISEWVEGPKLMARFAHTSWKDAQAQAEPLSLDGFLLSGSHYIDELVSSTDMPNVVLELPANAHHLTEALEHIELDAISLFHDTKFTEELIQPWTELNIPILMHLGSHDIQESWQIIQTSPLDGMNVQGGAEEKVGLKSFEELDELYDLLIDEA